MNEENRAGRSVVALAQTIATEAHAGQFRRDGVTPYVDHPRTVAGRVRGDDDAEAVAWLHDVLEDSSFTPEDLRARGVSQAVIEAVVLLTKPEHGDYLSYLENVRNHALARKVKIADMLSNLADEPTERQIIKYAQGLLVLLGARPQSSILGSTSDDSNDRGSPT